MSDPVPLNYGEANWQDFNNNWRKKDGDFLQRRSIVRYETTATRDAIVGPEAGMVVYNFQTDRLEMRTKLGTWSGLYTIDGLTIERSPDLSTGPDIKMRHPSAPANNGMVFSSSQITTQVPLGTSGGEVKMDSTGLTVKTGTKIAKLTTDAADLITDTRIKTPGLLSTGHVRVDQTATFVGGVQARADMSVWGLLTVSGQISLAQSPTAAGHATRMDYVDGRINTRVPAVIGNNSFGLGGRFVFYAPTVYGGGTDEAIAVAGGNPYIGFHQHGIARRAYIQATADWLVLGGENNYGIYFGGSGGGNHITSSYAVWGGMVVGRGAHGWPGLWVAGESDVAGYRFLSYGSATYVNATGSVGLRINNTENLLVTQYRCSMTGHFWASQNPPNGDWQNSAFVSYASGGHYSRIAFHWPGYAPMVRGGAGRETIDAISWNSGTYVQIICSSVYQTSALKAKKGVRSLRPERSAVADWHDPLSKEAALPNIMALRPVAYRLANDPTRLTYTDGKHDGGTEPEPYDSVWGREQRRERLGLIADEVQYVVPSAVSHTAEGDPEAMDYSQITVALLDHVQWLTERVETLEGVTTNGHVSNGHVAGNGHKAAIAA